jgi:hypothetical protein
MSRNDFKPDPDPPLIWFDEAAEFNEGKWEQVRKILSNRKTKPDVIISTGDKMNEDDKPKLKELPDPEKRKDYGAYITLEEDDEGKWKIVGGKNPEQVFEEIANSKPEEWGDPRGSSKLRSAYQAWNLKKGIPEHFLEYMRQMSMSEEEFRKLYLGTFGDWDSDKLAHDMWVIYDMNADILHEQRVMTPYGWFCWVAGNSSQMAFELGYRGSYAQWAVLIRDMGVTHDRGKCCGLPAKERD